MRKLLVLLLLFSSVFAADPIVTDSTSVVTTTGSQTTKVESPPPSAIAPQFGSGNNSDLCTISSSGSVQTQILGLSVGTTYTEENCLRLKKAQKLYMFGMKVAAVSVMCQDPDVWEAMMSAGTPCPIDGLIGDEAKRAWAVKTDKIPMPKEKDEISVAEKRDKALSIMGTVAAAFCSFSYTFGYTSNAAIYGNTWQMNTGTLGISAEEGLDISGVLYNYTVVKNVVDDFTVTIENDNADGGYVFQEEHDWDGHYSGTVQNVIPLPYTPIEQFGDGRIKGTGTGSIEDVTILYMYRWDLCRNAQNDESCPNYIPPLPVIPVIEIYDALEDDAVDDATKETDSDLYEKEKEEVEQDSEEEEDKERLELAMAATENALTIANSASQASVLKTMNSATNVNTYYVATVPGGVYRESISLQGGNIVDNRNALRSLSQDKQHQQMIEEQYK